MTENIKTIEDLYIKYQPKIYSYFYYQTNNSSTAEELCQEVFLRAFRGLPGFRGGSSLKTWIYSIAHNLYATWYRRETKYQFTELNDDSLEFMGLTCSSPEEAAVNREKAEGIKQILLKLSEEYRTVIILCDLHGLSYSEIAQALNWSLSKVKVTLYRARIKFKTYCEGGGEADEMSSNS